MYITLYFIVARLPDSLRAVRDHFLTLDLTDLTIDLLEKHLLAPETSVVAVGASRGTPCTPFFEGCSPSPLAPSYAIAAAVDILGTEDVGAASALSGKRRSGKGQEGKSGGGGSRGGGGGGDGGGEGGSGGGSGGFGGSGGGSGGSGGGGGGGSGSGGGGSGGGRGGAVHRRGSGGGQRQQQQRRSEAPTPKQLREWFAQCGASGGSVRCPYVIRTGASESALPGTAPAEALHTFTLDLGASRYFFRDSFSLTPLPAPVPVRLADPSGGPVLARSSAVIPCLANPSGSLSGLHVPSFSTKLLSTAAFQDVMVTNTTPSGQRVSICTCTRTGRHLATFTRRPGSSLYTLTTEPPQVAVSGQVSASGPVAAPARVASYHTRLSFGTTALVNPPCHAFVACTPDSLFLVFPAPHSSSFPPTTAPLQTLHMDVWGLARFSGQDRERYFLLVVDDYTRYTTVFPLRSNGEVPDVLIPWMRAVRLQLRERFREDLPVLHLRSNRGGEFSSDLLREFCRGEGILQSLTLPDFPQQNRIAERRIGIVMEVARTSMIHASAPHFLWSFAGSRDLVRDTSANKLSSHAIPCVFLGFPPDAPGWQFYHPTSRRVLSSQDVIFDKSVPFYHLFPCLTAPLLSPLLFLVPGPFLVDPLPPQGPAPSGVSQVDPLPLAEPFEVTVDSGAAGGGAARGAASGGAEPAGAASRGAEPASVEHWGAETEGAEPEGAVSEGAESRGAEPRGTASAGGPAGASP
ncbi:unnamed protein product [Closterium sp. NIES-54]